MEFSSGAALHEGENEEVQKKKNWLFCDVRSARSARVSALQEGGRQRPKRPRGTARRSCSLSQDHKNKPMRGLARRIYIIHDESKQEILWR